MCLLLLWFYMFCPKGPLQTVCCRTAQSASQSRCVEYTYYCVVLILAGCGTSLAQCIGVHYNVWCIGSRAQPSKITDLIHYFETTTQSVTP